LTSNVLLGVLGGRFGIDRVVQELKSKMQVQVEEALTVAIRKDRHSPRKVFRNLDIKTTLRRKLAECMAEIIRG